MAAESLTETRAKLERAKSTIRNLRERGARTAQLTTHAAMSAAGGASAAVLDRHMPTVGGLDSKMVAGVAITLVGITEMAGEWSDEILAMGSGMLAVTSYQLTATALAAPRGE